MKNWTVFIGDVLAVIDASTGYRIDRVVIDDQKSFELAYENVLLAAAAPKLLAAVLDVLKDDEAQLPAPLFVKLEQAVTEAYGQAGRFDDSEIDEVA